MSSCVCAAYECASSLQRRVIQRRLNALVKVHGLLHPHLLSFHTFRLRQVMKRRSCTVQEAYQWNQQHPRACLKADQRKYQTYRTTFHQQLLRWAKCHPVMWEAWTTKNLMQLQLLHRLIQQRRRQQTQQS